MTHLPYVPPPYPDEILGSWLARISLHNGDGAWRSLLEANGYGTGLGNPMFNMVDYDEKIERLLVALGTTYEEAMMRLTTLPYWLAFDAEDPTRGPLPGTKNTPRLTNSRKDVPVWLSQRGVALSNGKSVRLWFCPQCLAHDNATLGEAFWHKAHQLPNVFWCHHHNCSLRAACPGCGQDIGRKGRKLISLPPLLCPCGFNLREIQYQGSFPSAYINLVRVSVDALSSGLSQWDGSQVRKYLRSQLSASTGAFCGRYKSVLSSAFGVTGNLRERLIASVPGHDCNDATLRLHGEFSKAAAPECCALLAALNIEFNTAARCFVEMKPDKSPPKQGTSVSIESLTIEFVRREISARAANNPNDRPFGSLTLYWYLMIHDPKWLDEHFPPKFHRPFPSVLEDRAKILRILENTFLRPSERHRKLLKSIPGLRARLRDQEWLGEQLDELLRDRISREQTQSENLRHCRVVSIEEALQRLVRDEQGRPRRINTATLTGVTCLSQIQIGNLIRSTPHLKDAISAANADRLRRVLLWAARQLHAEGHHLSAFSICTRAETRCTKDAVLLCEAIITELGATGVRTLQGQQPLYRPLFLGCEF